MCHSQTGCWMLLLGQPLSYYDPRFLHLLRCTNDKSSSSNNGHTWANAENAEAKEYVAQNEHGLQVQCNPLAMASKLSIADAQLRAEPVLRLARAAA